MTPERIKELRRYLAGYQHVPFGGPGELPTLLDIAERFARLRAILEPLRALEAAATPGPWSYWPGYGISPEPGCTLVIEGKWSDIDPPDDTACIIAARNALPALLREIQETP